MSEQPAGPREPSVVNAPLSEVVYGVNFVAPEFSVVHYGEYFERIKNRFKTHKDIIPIAKQTQDQFQVPGLPRVWYESENRLIQLQIDRFVYNWRKITGTEEGYPGFEVLAGEFLTEWERFFVFTKEAFEVPIDIEEVNLTYINHIENVDSLETPIFSFRDEWRREFPQPELWLSQIRFPFPEENLKLTVTARPAIQVATQKRVTAFELLLQSIKVPDLGEFESWFRTAHYKVHWAFRRLVRPEWLDQWGFKT